MKIYSTLLAFGDSLTYGSRDEFGWSYPAYLSKLVKEKYNQLLVFENAGIPGETISEAVRRAYRVIKGSGCYEVVFFEGTNDAKDSVRTPIDVYEFSVEYIVELVEILDKKLYLGLIPDLRGFGAQDYSNRSKGLISKYNEIIKKVANKHNIPLIDFRGMPIEYYSDGVHLNSIGYKKMAERVLEAIEKERKYD